MSESTPNYEPYWLELKRRERVFNLLFWLYVPAFVVAVLLFDRFVHALTPWLFLIFSTGWMLGLCWFGIQVLAWRCPRCMGTYFSRALLPGGLLRRVNPFTRRCLHCGLRKWTLTPDRR